MLSTAEIIQIATWSGYLTLLFAALTILAWFLKWGFRFRLVGVTSFMAVLTGGLFALSLGLYDRPAISGAIRFTRVYDTGAAQVVITVPPSITPTELEATLQQAAADLYSTGRLSQGGDQLTIRARTIVHPNLGVSQPLYLGEIKRSLAQRQDDGMEIQIFEDQFAQLPPAAA
jgi:hypothetical protein